MKAEIASQQARRAAIATTGPHLEQRHIGHVEAQQRRHEPAPASKSAALLDSHGSLQRHAPDVCLGQACTGNEVRSAVGEERLDSVQAIKDVEHHGVVHLRGGGG